MTQIVLDTKDIIIGILVPLVAAFLAGPLVMEFSYAVFAWYEKKFRYPSWVAVFLEGGQVYFGKVTKLTREHLRLSTIYYIKDDSDFKQAKKKNDSGLSLIKLGGEVHGPEDFMLINRQHIIFLENLTEEGGVVKAIKRFETEGEWSEL